MKPLLVSSLIVLFTFVQGQTYIPNTCTWCVSVGQKWNKVENLCGAEGDISTEMECIKNAETSKTTNSFMNVYHNAQDIKTAEDITFITTKDHHDREYHIHEENRHE